MKRQASFITVQWLLIKLGVSPKTRGYGFLAKTVYYILERKPESTELTEACLSVAQKERTTVNAVQKDMAFAITRVYNLNSLQGLNKLYNAQIINEQPTLSEFVNYMAEYLYTFYPYEESYA